MVLIPEEKEVVFTGGILRILNIIVENEEWETAGWMYEMLNACMQA
jgi:hypothetical protein